MNAKANKIVVLDGFTLNPGDLDWSGLELLGEKTVVYDRSAPAEVLERAAGAEVIFVNKVVMGKGEIAALPSLRYIGVLATGYNVVDIAAAKQAGITVTNIPTYGTTSVAQHTLALLLELTNRVGDYSASVRAGAWSRSPDFCYYVAPLTELSGKRFGIVGYGRIGRETGKLARAFGMEVVAADAGYGAGVSAADDGTPLLPLDELLRSSDVISLHCPLNSDNIGMINAARLREMKRGAFLLNTSRGPLINAGALAEALRSGQIAGAGIDVLEVEPPPLDNPLFSAPNVLITPHVAWGTPAARRRLLDIAVENLRAWLDGSPANVVS